MCVPEGNICFSAAGSSFECFWPTLSCNGPEATDPQNGSSFHSLVIYAASSEVLFYWICLIYYPNSEYELYASVLLHWDCLWTDGNIWCTLPRIFPVWTPIHADLDEIVTGCSWFFCLSSDISCRHVHMEEMQNINKIKIVDWLQTIPT